MALLVNMEFILGEPSWAKLPKGSSLERLPARAAVELTLQ